MAGSEQASDRILQGPDSVCSAQTTRDIKLTIQTLERISSTFEDRRLVSSVGRAPDCRLGGRLPVFRISLKAERIFFVARFFS